MRTSRFRSRLIRLLACLACLVFGAGPALAFVIKDYQVSVKVRADSLLEFEETLQVNFMTSHHGIYRLIPVSYLVRPVEGEQARRASLARGRYTVQVMDVETPGWPVDISRKDDYLVIRIGDPDRLIEGVHRYVIRYTIYGGINFFKNHAELYWNLIGTKWGATIQKASFSIQFPKPLTLQERDVFVYTGALGERNQDVIYKVGSQGITGSITKELRPRHGLTVGVRFPDGYLEEGGLWFKIRLIFINSPVLWIPIGLFIILLPLWWFRGRDQRLVIVPLFDPPMGMTPPEMTFLVSEGVGPRNMVSLFPYWGAQGLLRIEALPGADDGEDDYRLTKLGELGPKAMSWEHTIFDKLFEGGKDTVLVSEKKEKFGDTMAAAAAGVEEYADARGWFTAGSRGLGISMLAAGFVVIFMGLVWAFLSCFKDDEVVSWANSITILSSGLMFVIFGRIMPQKATPGQALYAEVMGFKEFVERAEQGKLRMLLKEQPDYFDRTLAFAMALGLAEQWGEKFQNLLSRPPDWFVGPGMHSGAWALSGLAHGLGHFSEAAATGLSSTPSDPGGTGFSSGGGGFGGGGFSGGGGGGGGGGGW